MDALELLKHDHQMVKGLFEQAEGMEDQKEQKQIFRQIKKELETHARIEEEVFYSEKFEPKLQVLMENVEHHAEEEEEGKMFSQVRRIVDQASPRRTTGEGQG